MRAKDIMSMKPEFAPPTWTLKQAADRMRTHDYGFLPVGENDRLIGVVTDRDLTVRAIAEGKDPNKTTLRDVMSKGIQFCWESDDLENVVQQMERLQVRRLVVLNKDKRDWHYLTEYRPTKAHNPTLCSELTDAVSHH